jgi:formyl-CoA transferase
MLGPCATQVLADYGADVIKIERAGGGDICRGFLAARDPAGLTNPVFGSLNRNKRSVELDLRRPESKELVLRLIDGADVVANNFRAGVMERMGFSYDELSKRNPRLIYAVGTGYGLSGPYIEKGGQDVLAQAMSGVMARRSDPAHPVSIYPTTMADYSAGMHLVQGVLLALLQRQKTGRGQVVSVSLLDSMIAAQMQEAAMHLMRGADLNWGAMPLTGVFETTDGAVVMVGGFKSEPLKYISLALEMADISADPRFASFELQAENRAALHALWRARFRTNTTDYWLARLDAQDLLCAPVRTLGQALADEQARINDMILEAEGPEEKLRFAGSPVHLADAKVRIRRAPPKLGEHTAEIMAQLAPAKRAGVA